MFSLLLLPELPQGGLTDSSLRSILKKSRFSVEQEEEDEELDAAAQAVAAQAVRASKEASRAERLSRRGVVHDQIEAAARIAAMV